MLRKTGVLFILLVPVMLFGQDTSQILQKTMDRIGEINKLISKDEVDLSLSYDHDKRSSEGITESEKTVHYYHTLNDYLKIIATSGGQKKDEQIMEFYFTPEQDLFAGVIEQKEFSRHIYLYAEDNPLMYASQEWDPQNARFGKLQLKTMNTGAEKEADMLLKQAVKYYNATSAFADDLAFE